MKRILFTLCALCVFYGSLEAQGRCPLTPIRTITLEPGRYQHVRMGNLQHGFRIHGNFKFNGGKADFYITDGDGFADFLNHKKFKVYFSSEKTAEVKFDLNLEQGNYDLVWLNRSGDRRVIEGELCFGAPEEK
jgi:hypothetical protein